MRTDSNLATLKTTFYNNPKQRNINTMKIHISKKMYLVLSFILLTVAVPVLPSPSVSAAQTADSFCEKFANGKPRAKCIAAYNYMRNHPTGTYTLCRGAGISRQAQTACDAGKEAGKKAAATSSGTAGAGAPSAARGISSSCTNRSCDLMNKYINPAINALSALIGILAAASLIFAGIQYITSAGDPQKASDAKDRISKTIVGLLLFGFLYAFIQFLIPGGVFNLSATP